jgi:xanthine/uracil/vitamin C permease (AzgA family)
MNKTKYKKIVERGKFKNPLALIGEIALFMFAFTLMTDKVPGLIAVIIVIMSALAGYLSTIWELPERKVYYEKVK